MSEDSKPPRLSLNDVSAGVKQVERVRKPSLRDQLAKEREDRRTDRLANDARQTRIDALTITIKLRITYAAFVSIYLVAYSIAVFYILYSVGIGKIYLPSNVVVVAVGSTAVAAIGLVSQIGKGLFPSK